MKRQYRLPSINAPTLAGQVAQIRSYLRQLAQQLNQEPEERQAQATAQTADQTAQDFRPIRCYPVGTVYLSLSDTPPQTLFGGRWEKLEGRFLLGAGDAYPPGSRGGQLPQLVEGEPSAGAGTTLLAAGEALPPYLAVNLWKRIG